MLRTAFWNCFQQKRGFSCFRITANRFDPDSGRIAQKCSSAAKTGFGRNGRQTKSSPGRGEFRTSKGLLLAFDCHIGTRKCSKFVVKCEKIVVFRGIRGCFGANSGSAVAQKQDLDHNILLYAFFIISCLHELIQPSFWKKPFIR